MNLWLLAAGMAALVLDLIHVFPGGREIHRPMVASHWPEPAKAVWSVVWHAATAVMALGGLALIAAGLLPPCRWRCSCPRRPCSSPMG
jgi:hypothetical protein